MSRDIPRDMQAIRDKAVCLDDADSFWGQWARRVVRERPERMTLSYAIAAVQQTGNDTPPSAVDGQPLDAEAAQRVMQAGWTDADRDLERVAFALGGGYCVLAGQTGVRPGKEVVVQYAYTGIFFEFLAQGLARLDAEAIAQAMVEQPLAAPPARPRL